MTVSCTKCGEEKSLSEFPPDKKRKLGVTTQCRVCTRERLRQFYERHPGYQKKQYRKHREKRLEQQREYHASQPEGHFRERSRKARERDPEGYKEIKRRWRQENREKIREQTQAWYAANPERGRELRRNTENRRRARLKQLPNENVDTAVVFDRDAGVCGICNEAVNPDDWHLDHIIPLAAGGSHTYENVQVAHPSCNIRKGCRTVI